MLQHKNSMTSSKKQNLVRLIKTQPVRIAQLCGFEDMGDLHNQWLLRMLFCQEDQTLLAHRGSYKTTCLSVALALMLILWPRKKIIFLRKTDEDVVEVIQQVRKILETGVFGLIVQVLYGIDLTVSSSMTKIDTCLNTGTQGAVQLLGIGTSGSLTGKHADIVITDDIVNLKDRASKAERGRIKAVYQELQNIKNRGGRMINTGTPWHKEDAISTMPNVERFDCYTTGMIPQEKLQEIRQSMSSSLFAANYELRHIAAEDVLFTDPQFTSDTDRIYDGIAHIDAAYGGGDHIAYTILRETDGKLYVFGKMFKGHIDDHLAEIYSLHELYRAGTIYSETNADKGYLRKQLKADGIPSRGYHENQNKHIKITTYLKGNWKDVVFLSDTDPDYLAEILDYTETAEHDDCPDSLASLIRIHKRKGRVHTIEGGI